MGILQATGKVIDYRNGIAKVEVLRQSSCGHCQSADHCDSGQVSRMLSPASVMKVDALAHQPVAPGDQVTLTMPDGMVFKGVVLAYLLPLLLAAVLVGLGWLLNLNELLITLMVTLGLVSGFVIASKVSSRLVEKPTIIDTAGTESH